MGNISTAKSLLNSDNVLPPVRPVSTLSTLSCTTVPTDTSLATKNNSKNFVWERSLSSETSSTVSTPVKPCQLTSNKPSKNGVKKCASTTNFWFKDSTPESTELSTSSNATTDVTTNATSEATATVCQECTTEDHVSVCHVPQAPNSDFAVSKLSTLTGTIVVTEASRPVPKNKSMEVTSTTNSTSTKSTRNITLTTKDLYSLTMTGTDKSTNGALRLLLVLKKSFFANTQDTTRTQLKLKSINSMLSSENKLRSGSVFKKTKCTVKSKSSTKESRAVLLNGNCAPNKWSTRSKPTGKDVWPQENQNFQSSLLVFTVNVLTNVLFSKRD